MPLEYCVFKHFRRFLLAQKSSLWLVNVSVQVAAALKELIDFTLGWILYSHFVETQKEI